MRNKIYNGFIFFNEFNMLDIRLDELNDVVDKFILVESPHTHRGGTKRLFFDERKHEYEKYRDKLIHVIQPLPEYTGDAWLLENEHRRGILHACKDLQANDYLILNDADEIPRANIINNFATNNIPTCKLAMRFYYYKFNLINKGLWDIPMAIRYGDMTEDINKYRADRNDKKDWPVILDAGWHFSKCYCMANLKYMFKECLADNLFYDEIMNSIEDWAAKGETHWCGHDNKFNRVPIDSSFPAYVRNNVEKLKDYIA